MKIYILFSYKIQFSDDQHLSNSVFSYKIGGKKGIIVCHQGLCTCTIHIFFSNKPYMVKYILHDTYLM